MAKYTEYVVDQPFPGAVPTHEGATLEIEKPGGGLVLFVQLPGLTAREAKAFKDLRRYYYLQPQLPVPIAYWVFDFAPPLARGLECNLDARLYDRARVEAWMDESEGLKNMLTLYLLDGQMLRGIKIVGLQHEAVRAFHVTLRRQIATPYTSADYTRYLRAFEQYTVEDIKKMARNYKK